MLAVSDGNAAIEFYKAAFGAEVLWDLGGGGVAGMSIHGAQFFLAHESPEYGTRSPSSAGFTTVRIELFVEDPVAVQGRARARGRSHRAQSGKGTSAHYGGTKADQADAARGSRGPIWPPVAHRKDP